MRGRARAMRRNVTRSAPRVDTYPIVLRLGCAPWPQQPEYDHCLVTSRLLNVLRARGGRGMHVGMTSAQLSIPALAIVNKATPMTASAGRCDGPMDTLGIEPRASRMLSGCDTTTPCAHVLELMRQTVGVELPLVASSAALAIASLAGLARFL